MNCFSSSLSLGSLDAGQPGLPSAVQEEDARADVSLIAGSSPKV